MAVDQDHLDDIAASVTDLYRELESALNRTIAQRLADELDSPFQITKLDAVGALRRSAQLLISTLQATRARVVRDAIGQAYRDGYGSALTDLPEGWFPRSGIGQAARAAQQEIPNAPVIENIAQALHRDLGRVEGNILRNVLDAYRSVQAAAAARIVSGAFTRRQAAQAAWQRLVDRGVTSFADSAGRRWKLSSYAEMITRTNAARAAVQGQTDRLTTIGVRLVIASDHGQECKLCRPYEGKILAISGPTGQVQVQHATRDGEMVTVDVIDTLDGARAKGFQHPNCRHSVSAYLPGLTKQLRDTADPQGDQARQRQREIERQIRKFKERAGTALTPEGKKAANAKVRQWQGELRNHLAAHPDLKRLRYREQPGAGNTPPKSGPAGGPVGDLQPPVQPTLDGGPGARRPTPEAEQPRAGDEQVPGQQDLLDLKPARKPRAKAAPKPKTGPRGPRKPKGKARKYHRDLDGIEDLADAVENGFPPDDRRPLGGGAVADVELLTLKGGRKVVRKKARPTSGGIQEAAGEQIASKVAQKLGLRAPKVYRRDEDEIFMDYVDNAKTADDITGWGQDPPKRVKDVPNTDNGKRLGLLDLLIHNYDRNAGNWMLDEDDQLIPIDHGVAYTEMLDGNRVDLEYIYSPFAEHYTQGDNPLTREDVDDVRRRLEELRPDFEHIGHGDWLDYSLRVLDELAKRATGTRNLFAGVR
ncbi:hypothetical protein Ssi03_25770 [Sphaerisporangium siamense]|uniref:Minor capsid protein n=1 Tax=Sphaerisporangium siamense TaxID=795645 RepID=A0A7W7D4T2_9ACTN|nr:phage minor capsid protein [Sphaerisporangium siamense]MBB4700096.1 hypothetical protein [Sphaerisporangium siamense]GII84587.1 hypothetical protein Ssi03_25770 [Sphaerisporangium siamense]